MGGRGKSKVSSSLSGEALLGTKVGGQGGSNPGGVYQGGDGVTRYVKFYSDPTQAYEEHLSNAIYRELGLGAPESIVFEVNGKVAYGSTIIEGGQILNQHGLTPDVSRLVAQGFAADVLTANWDAVGLVHDNILLKGGQALRIDSGGTFLHRAQGGKKPGTLLNKISEYEGFFNPSVNHEYQQVMSRAGYKAASDIPSLKSQVQRIQAVRQKHGNWQKFVDKTVPGLNRRDREAIATQLESRTQLLVERVGL